MVGLVLLASFSCEDTTGERLAGTDFVRKADAICERSRAEIRAVDAPEDDSLTEVARVLDRTLPVQRDALDDLGEIEPPDDVERDYEQYLRLQREALRDLEAAHEAAVDGDRDTFDQVRRRAQSKYADIHEHAREAGLRTCSGES